MPRAPSGARGATLSPVPDITDTHRRLVLGYALRRVDEPADAADVVAETFLVAWRRLGDVPEGEAARGWLLGVARRVLANHRRGEHRRDGLADRLARELMAVPVERDGHRSCGARSRGSRRRTASCSCSPAGRGSRPLRSPRPPGRSPSPCAAACTGRGAGCALELTALGWEGDPATVHTTAQKTVA